MQRSWPRGKRGRCGCCRRPWRSRLAEDSLELCLGPRANRERLVGRAGRRSRLLHGQERPRPEAVGVSRSPHSLLVLARAVRLTRAWMPAVEQCREQLPSVDSHESAGTNGIYAELHCLSNFSFLRGASHPRELVTNRGRARLCGARVDRRVLRGRSRASAYGGQGAAAEARRRQRARLRGRAQSRRAGRRSAGVCGAVRAHQSSAARGSQRRVPRRPRRRRRMSARARLAALAAELLANTPPMRETGRWLQERFAGRLWLAVELLNAGNDRRRLQEARALGRELAVPLVAAGNVHMHCRERRMLQDTLTAIRRKVPLDELGFELHSNAERCLRPIDELVRRYPAELLRESLAILERVNFSLDGAALRISVRADSRGRDAGELSARVDRARLPVALAGRGVAESAQAHRARARADRRAALRGVFPNRSRHRELRPQHRHLVPRQRLGCEFRRVLLL